MMAAPGPNAPRDPPAESADAQAGTDSPCTTRWWDDYWDGTGGVKRRRTRPSHYLHGSRGIVVRTLRQVIGDRPIESVCEFGGGGGMWLMAVARALGARATCIDVSASGLAMTRQVFEWTGLDVELIHADIFEHDFGGRRFDLVTHWGLIEHFPDPVRVFERTAEVLAPSGLTVFGMPNMTGFSARWWREWAPETDRKSVV